MNTKGMLTTIIIGIIVFTAIVHAFNHYMGLPDVHFSYSSGECVKVVNYGTNYTCENYPEKFHHVWVQ